MSFPLPPPMRRALDLAAEAALAGEVPVGAVVTRGEEIVAEARNAMRNSLDPNIPIVLLGLVRSWEGYV